MFLTKNKIVMLVAIILLVSTLLVYLLDYARCAKLVCTNIYTDNDVQKFLNRFKIKVEGKPLEVTQITIPPVFDQVYNQYETLQNKMGYSLKEYRGTALTRYTYKVTNHQKSNQEEILAHVFVSGNQVVAADVCSVKLDGFMIPLTEFKNQMK